MARLMAMQGLAEAADGVTDVGEVWRLQQQRHKQLRQGLQATGDKHNTAQGANLREVN